MNAPVATLVLQVADTDESIELGPFRAVVAGYTGRDAAQVQHHIDELAAIGVAPPPQVPMIYPMPDGAVTSAAELTVNGDNTSGEVEPVLIRHAGRFYLGVGSDHTDRTLETADIAESKAVCPKPIGETVVPIENWTAFDWDHCLVRSTVDGVVYQDGSLAGLRRPEELWDIVAERLDLADDEDVVCFAGTLPLIDGAFVPGHDWELRIALPDGRLLTHSYSITITKDI
ncbi:DUF2848 domain-containing protein [Tsukamurella asaccharolytica]|uniref:DUF2848 domain-containing protein n=1 Tax=Tsukamurella asaccharolytica TaxID=2592067 RepID=A0A5C5RFS7_9ACTN|nr:DUF2848 family protein [Tsukamurella asaccharolytica]TWS21522.1 DUF2848 domain-containing protein [Tsukamurella asaccharolytica]